MNWKNEFPQESRYFETENGIPYKLCIICGKKILKKKNESLNSFLKRKFCSRKCCGIYRSCNMRGNNNPNWKGGFIKKVCPLCGKEFIVELKNKGKKYCSKKCWRIHRSEIMKGENNPFYNKKHFEDFKCYISKLNKGRKHTDEAKRKMSEKRKGRKFTKEHRLKISKALYKGSCYKTFKEKIRRSWYYKEWRRQVFERDDYTCQICGKKGCYLEVHHIKPFSKFPELWFDVDNGLAVCKKCHIEIHREDMKGNKNASKNKENLSWLEIKAKELYPELFKNE